VALDTTVLFGRITSAGLFDDAVAVACTSLKESALQLTAGSCVTGTNDAAKSYKLVSTAGKPSLYLSVYTAAATTQANFLYKGTVQIDGCSDLTTVGAGYAKATRSGSTFSVAFYASSDSGCTGSTTLTVTTITVDGVAVNSGTYYYGLSSAVKAYTAPTSFFVGVYNASTCAVATAYTGDQALTTTCDPQTDVTTKTKKLTFTFPGYTLKFGCGTSCATPCDAADVAVVINGASNCAAGTAAWYKVTTATQDVTDSDDAAGIMSFAMLALCALLALLF